MKASFRTAVLLGLTAAAVAGCAPPQASAPQARKEVYVNLDSLVPLHPAYSLLLRKEPTTAPTSRTGGKRAQEPLPSVERFTLSQLIPPPVVAENFTSAVPASSLTTSLADDRRDALIGVKTVLGTRRQAASDLMAEQFEEERQKTLDPLRELARRSTEAQLDEIVALQAHLAAPDLAPEVRTTSEERLKALRSEREASLQAEQRRTALQLQDSWVTGTLRSERQLGGYDTGMRQSIESAFMERMGKVTAGVQGIERTLGALSAPRLPVAREEMTAATTSMGEGAALPDLPREGRDASLLRIREEVAAAVAQVAAHEFWSVSFVPRAGTEDVTAEVGRMLTKWFYPKS